VSGVHRQMYCSIWPHHLVVFPHTDLCVWLTGCNHLSGVALLAARLNFAAQTIDSW
jgi:hypothetical protein